MALYDKPVKLLFRDMVEDLDIQKDEVIERDRINSWFKTNYPLVKSGTISAHMIKLSINAPSRITLYVDPNGNDDLLFQIDSKSLGFMIHLLIRIPIYFRPKEKEAETNGHDEKKKHMTVSLALRKRPPEFLIKKHPSY